MAAKKTTRTVTPSTSAPASKPEADASAVSTSDSGVTPTPPTELPLSTANNLGDMTDWINHELLKGAQAVVAVLGAEMVSLTAKLPEGKRTQSLPPGDILVVVLPPGTGRKADVYLVTPKPK